MRYFLHILEATSRTDDPDGSDFDSVDDARREAVAGIRDLLAEEMRLDGKCRLAGRSIEIADVTGLILDRIQFREAATVEA